MRPPAEILVDVRKLRAEAKAWIDVAPIDDMVENVAMIATLIAGLDRLEDKLIDQIEREA